MTDLEKMKHAHNYILNLANGVDPISTAELPSDSCLNNVSLSRCFFYVADVLKEVIGNGGVVARKYQGSEFVLTDDFKSVKSVDEALQITHFIKPINDIAGSLGMKKIPATAFTEWLIDKGYLEEIIWGENKRRKEPTKKGEEFGIITEIRNGQYGSYKAVLYPPNVQAYILEHLEEIVERWKNKSIKPA